MPQTGTGSSATLVTLHWIPLGAGDAPAVVRWSGRAFEAAVARHESRGRLALYHSALVVISAGERYTIEMAPVWDSSDPLRTVACEGAVGSRLLGRLRAFRYEVRRWHDGVIPDLDDAGVRSWTADTDPSRARLLLELTSVFPTATWGRDEQHTGEMWNSNSLTSWLLLRSGHSLADVAPPPGGRAPGWDAGRVVAARDGVVRPPGLPERRDPRP